MMLALRLILAALVCSLAGAAGWWLHQPVPLAGIPPAQDEASLPGNSLSSAGSDDDSLSKRITAADPFGLSRNTPLSPAAAGTAAAPGSELITWRFGALVVRGNERYLLLTAPGQAPLRVAEGEKLPDGEKIKSIQADHAVIQGVRGRTRTIYLTEP